MTVKTRKVPVRGTRQVIRDDEIITPVYPVGSDIPAYFKGDRMTLGGADKLAQEIIKGYRRNHRSPYYILKRTKQES